MYLHIYWLRTPSEFLFGFIIGDAREDVMSELNCKNIARLTWLPPLLSSVSGDLRPQSRQLLRGGSSHSSCDLQISLMIASVQTSYCLTAGVTAGCLTCNTTQWPPGPWSLLTSYQRQRALALPSQLLIHVYWIVFTHRQR